MEACRAETEMVIYPLEFYRRSERQWKHRVKASTPRPYASRAPDGHSAGIIAIKVGQSRVVEKIPKTKDEIQRLIIAELRTFAQCEKAWGIVVVPIVDHTGVATWTVSRFHRGQSSAYACDRALQRIVPHYQQLYDLAQKH